jgi:hypothetical protein
MRHMETNNRNKQKLVMENFNMWNLFATHFILRISLLYLKNNSIIIDRSVKDYQDFCEHGSTLQNKSKCREVKLCHKLVVGDRILYVFVYSSDPVPSRQK